MNVTPAFEPFAKIFAQKKGQVVWTKLVSDIETPVSAMLKLTDGQKNAFLLESIEGGESRGRYSFIGLKPDLIWKCKNGQAEINKSAKINDQDFVPCTEAPLESLQSLIHASFIDLPEDLPPMSAGLFGYLGYDMVREMEKLPNENPDPLNVEDSIFIRPTIIVAFDGVKNEMILISPVWAENTETQTAESAYQLACERLSEAAANLQRGLPHTKINPADIPAQTAPTSNFTKDEYLSLVERAKEYIRAGDIFQVVPSQRFATEFPLPPFALYRSLRRLNPSPFMFYLNFGSHCVIGSSPEILVRVRDGKVTIRPIAGTRKRGATKAEDDALAADLLSDPKELSEHLMLLDLGRNDVGRVAKIGSVTVTEREIIEYYSHVMHIVSNVEGDIREGIETITALAAGFPAGTVSGAPKVRAMEIIDELENVRRGIYGGCIGYFGANGAMDSCIALRTAVLKDHMLYVQAGGGVVADSDPEAEYQETVNKSKALLTAAQEALKFARV